MNGPLSAHKALCRLLAAAWEPQGLPSPESIPWPGVWRLVESGNLSPSLYAATREMRGAIPPDIGQALKNAYYQSVADNARCLHQLVQVREALSSTGAPVLLLKGAALVETLYGDSSLRRIGDIDLAVPLPYVPACRQALLELGYVSDQIEHRPGFNLAYRNEVSFWPPSPFQAQVEMHWHILNVPYYLRKAPIDWFWENTELRSVAGQPFHLLSPEANLIYLPAHLALHHRFQAFHSFVDLALLIAHHRESLDWDRIIATARSFDLLAALRETLERMAQCWPSLPIDGPRRQLALIEPSRTDERLFRLLTADSLSAGLRFYATLASLPDPAAQARFIWVHLFPQPGYMMPRYNIQARWQLPYWYLYRLAEGLTRFARALPGARRLGRDRR